MSILSAVQALIELALPLLVLSWFLFHRLFTVGELERDAGHRAIRSQVKKNRHNLAKDGDRNTRFLHNRWAKFGGGFYGLAALWTFVVIEIMDLLGYLFSGEYLLPFADGLITFLINFLVNQFTNLVSAFVWFSYWPAQGGSLLVWVAAAYLGYWGGIELARRGTTPGGPFRSGKQVVPNNNGEVSNHENN